MTREAERIERAIPARLLWWSCKLMSEDTRDGDQDVCLALARAFNAVVLEQFADLSGPARDKALRRLKRAMDVAEDPLVASGTHVGAVLVACRVIVQRVWNAGCYEPCPVFLAAWDDLSEKVYDTCDNGRCLNAVEAEATAIAHAIVDRLHREHGLWRDLSRNERPATPIAAE